MSSDKLADKLKHVNEVQVIDVRPQVVDDEEKVVDADDADDEEQRLEMSEEKAPEQDIDRSWSLILEEIRERSQKRLCGVHIAAMLYKKWCYAKRDKRALLCQMILPMLFMLFGFAIIDLEQPSVYPRIELSLEHYGAENPQTPYNIEADGSTNPFPAVWSDMSASYGSLIGVNGGSTLYDYDSQLEQSLHIFGESLLEISNDKPFKYASLYFPTQSGTIGDSPPIDHLRHIGIGVNISAYHGLPISIHLANTLALRSVSPTASITTHLQPLPTTKEENAATQQIEAMFVSSFLSFALAFFPVVIMYNLVAERESSAKLQLLVSGMDSGCYWLGNWLFDAVTIVPTCLFALLLILAFESEAFLGEALAPFLLIVLLYGLSIVSFTYLFSWLFDSSTKAQYITLICYIFLGYGFSLATFIMDIIPSTRDFNKDFKVISRFSPSYCASRALLNLATKELSFVGLWEPSDSPFHWEVTGRLLCFMGWETVLYFLLTLAVEYLSTIPSVAALFGAVTNLPKVDMGLDPDVSKEQDKLKEFVLENESGVEQGFDFQQCSDPVILCGLRKVYNRDSLMKRAMNGCKVNPKQCVTAVHDLWYSVPRGQIFGFLGVNGAGKTSTLSMLCGKFAASEGMAFINQIPISNQIACRRMIGYCPQFDAIFDLLTAREHLTVYGMIKGLERKAARAESTKLMDSLTLTQYADKQAGKYSGGNKRKLSVAMAMIGSPPIVFLDEPSTGMDPVSKRSMWDFISQTMNGRSVVLTTHSMEECEALCHRIGIMVKGQLRCLGTSQRLKQRYGSGFLLDVNLGVAKHERLLAALNEAFDDNVEELERHDENIKFAVHGNEDKSYAEMFEILEALNADIGIDGGYALNQTTLENIFIQMASQYENQLQTMRTMNASASVYGR